MIGTGFRQYRQSYAQNKTLGHVTLFHCPLRSVWYYVCDIRDSANSIRRGDNFRRLT